jgi:type III pantothenate kinase
VILDIDIGNTRIKWLHRESDSVMACGAVFHRQLDDLPEARPERVRVVSVNEDMAEAVSELVRTRWGLSVERALVIDGAGGVVCGYEDPGRLGVDRWLAILAGFARFRGNLLIADAGSALTMDLVTREGVHQGGYIVPGLNVMKKSLFDATWGVKASGQGDQSLEPGLNTSCAVSHGSLMALVGALETAVTRFGVHKLVLTGGDGAALQALTRTPVETVYEPNLVLEGLQIALP